MRIASQGVYDLPLASYLGQCCEGWSFSSSDAVVVAGLEPMTLAHVRASWTKERKRVRNVDFGSCVHALALEPFRAHSMVALIDADDYRTKAAQAAAEDAMNAGKIPMLAEDYDRARSVADRLVNHPRISKWLKSGVVEQSCIAADELPGVFWKARPDLLTHDRVLLDIKTVAKASDRFIRNRIADGGWYIQSPWYCDIIRRLDGEMPQAFYWVCIEQNEPHSIRIIEPPSTTMDAGGRAMDKARGLFREAVRSGAWPAYEDKIEQLGLPDHAHYRLEEEALADEE